MSASSYSLAIPVRAYTGLLLTAVLTLVVLHSGLYLYNNRVEELPWLLLQLFDLDEEHNIPTWFSSYLLLNNAFFLALIAGSGATAKRAHWAVLAAGFLLLSIDEVAGLHETLNTAIDMNWAIPGGLLVVVVGIAFIPFLLALPKRVAMLLLVAGVMYVSGAIVVELWSEDIDSRRSLYALAVALEEGLEMLGALLCLHTILSIIKAERDSVVLVGNFYRNK